MRDARDAQSRDAASMRELQGEIAAWRAANSAREEEVATAAAAARETNERWQDERVHLLEANRRVVTRSRASGAFYTKVFHPPSGFNI